MTEHVTMTMICELATSLERDLAHLKQGCTEIRGTPRSMAWAHIQAFDHATSMNGRLRLLEIRKEDIERRLDLDDA